jgi:DNA-binding transcriptional MerR regulator
MSAPIIGHLAVSEGGRAERSPANASGPEVRPEDAVDVGLAEEAAYTIDDLAGLTGVPSRTIRFYQAKGALPPPTRRGRVAYYGRAHVERLRLVAQMQDRGLSLRAIRDLFERTEGADVSVGEWLGVGDRLRAPWTDDHSRVFTDAELQELLGDVQRPGLIADLVRGDLVRCEETRPGEYLVPSTGMLKIALQLEAAGINVETAQAAHDILKRRVGRAADELAEYFVNRADVDTASPEKISRSLDALRSLGMEAVCLVFAQEVERALRVMAEQGRMLPRRRRRR